MEKRTAAHATRIPRGKIRVAVATDDVIPRVPRMRRIVNPELCVVKQIERLEPELQRTPLREKEILCQREVKVCSAGIVEEVSSCIPERQSRRRYKKSRIAK